MALKEQLQQLGVFLSSSKLIRRILYLVRVMHILQTQVSLLTDNPMVSIPTRIENKKEQVSKIFNFYQPIPYKRLLSRTDPELGDHFADPGRRFGNQGMAEDQMFDDLENMLADQGLPKSG